MRVLKISYLLMIMFSIKLSAQFSFETFISDSLNQTITSIKDKLADKKIEEDLAGTFNRITYYDWLEPISIKVTFLFNKKNNKQISASISNVKELEEDAQKLFNMSIEVLTKNYGAGISKSFMGVTGYSWAGKGGSVITLVHESKKTRLMLMSFKNY